MRKFLTANRDALARRLFFLSVVMLAFAYGVGASHYGLFPVPFIINVKATVEQLLQETGARLPWYYQPSTQTENIRVRVAHAPAPGLRLVAGIGVDETSLVKVMTAEGRVVHSWYIDWFEIWPKPEHLTADLIPKSNRPLVHGVAVASNGDLIFNFEALGMVRLDACGEVIWKLPYRTHHSIHVDERGSIWAPGVVTRSEKRAALPNHEPAFDDYTILEVSPTGKILQELWIADLLLDNGLRALLHMSSISNWNTRVTGDTLHLNDVETFPASLAPGVFSPGDVMISLRNINTILVFDPKSRRIKFLVVGAMLRQHDPDFIDGNTISVFDNNNLSVWSPGEVTPQFAGHYSRIVRFSAATKAVDVRFSGTDQEPFFTYQLGNHELLPNGNTLLTESGAGRVIEVDASGQIVWEYFNLVGNGLVAVVDDALLLPREFDEAFFAQALSACAKPSQY